MINRLENRLFSDLVNQAFRSCSSAPASRAPGAYRYEDEDAYRLRLEIPGFSKEEVSLSVVDDKLTVKAESKTYETSYERTFNLPDTIEQEKISAKLENGILELTFPKAEVVEPTPRNIEISSTL